MRPTLRPEPEGRGLASSDPDMVAELVASAWDAMAGLARSLPLDRPSRLDGWSVRDVLVHLGAWDEHPVFSTLLEDARAGRVHEQDDTDARNAMLVAAHHDAEADEIAASLELARDRATAFLASDEAETIGRHWTGSPVGLLPVTGVVAASAYELAVHALDIAAPHEVPASLLDAGIGALVDTTGALAARAGVEATFVVSTPLGSWACGSEGDAWTTLRLDGEVNVRELRWPTVEGEAADVLDATAGRRPALAMVVSRRLRLHDVPGLMTLLPALDAVPGLPGGLALRTAAQALGSTGRIIGRLSQLARGG
jgi:uncharacterized protein (TIGR03083 family)